MQGVLFDEFVIAHVLGWVFKMFMFRDFYVSWFLSIWFELLEYTFQHILPNFAECWWDHVRIAILLMISLYLTHFFSTQWIVDVLICNALGIWIGSMILKKLESPVRQRAVSRHFLLALPLRVRSTIG